jgi:hypothetical protein
MGTVDSRASDGYDSDMDLSDMNHKDGDADAVHRMVAAQDELKEAEAALAVSATSMTEVTQDAVRKAKEKKEAQRKRNAEVFDLTWIYERIDHHNAKTETFASRLKYKAG